MLFDQIVSQRISLVIFLIDGTNLSNSNGSGWPTHLTSRKHSAINGTNFFNLHFVIACVPEGLTPSLFLFHSIHLLSFTSKHIYCYDYHSSTLKSSIRTNAKLSYWTSVAGPNQILYPGISRDKIEKQERYRKEDALERG